MKGFVIYLLLALTFYAQAIGDIQYDYQNHWRLLCPTADDYAWAIMEGAVPLTWPMVGLQSIGHVINEGKVPFALKIHASEYCSEPSGE